MEPDERMEVGKGNWEEEEEEGGEGDSERFSSIITGDVIKCVFLIDGLYKGGREGGEGRKGGREEGGKKM